MRVLTFLSDLVLFQSVALFFTITTDKKKMMMKSSNGSVVAAAAAAAVVVVMMMMMIIIIITIIIIIIIHLSLCDFLDHSVEYIALYGIFVLVNFANFIANALTRVGQRMI